MIQDHYSYFDIDALMEAQHFTDKEIEQGARLLKSGSMTLDDVEVG